MSKHGVVYISIILWVLALSAIGLIILERLINSDETNVLLQERRIIRKPRSLEIYNDQKVIDGEQSELSLDRHELLNELRIIKNLCLTMAVCFVAMLALCCACLHYFGILRRSLLVFMNAAEVLLLFIYRTFILEEIMN